MKGNCFLFGIILLFYSAFWLSCVRDMNIEVKPSKEQLVVEAYINNLLPSYNYVILTKTQDYYAPNFQSLPVSGAIVQITEGSESDGSIKWNRNNVTTLTEVNNNSLPVSLKAGVYFDPKIFTDSINALKGKIGKYYLLEIETGGKKYSSITRLNTPVSVDSLTVGYPFIDEEGIDKLRITNNYKDPDTLGNRQFYFWTTDFDNKNNFGWPALNKSRIPGRDDLNNGTYFRITYPQGFGKNATVQFFMASVTTEVWNFWDNYNKARDNNGPFATPVNLGTTLNGTNVIGCFSGMALSHKTIVVK